MRQYPEIKAGDDDERRPGVTFDRFFLQGRFAAGEALSVEMAGASRPTTRSA